MRIILTAFVLSSIVIGCANENAPDTTAEPAAAEEPAAEASSESDSRDPKWMIAIDGLPERTGRTMTAVTMGDEGYGNYAFGRSGFRGTVSYHPDDPSPSMMFKFDKEDVRCMNEQGAQVKRDGDQVVISGVVACGAASGDMNDATPTAIKGYFKVGE